MPLRRSEGGMGGRLGRSNMEHSDHQSDIKEQAKHARRQNDTYEIEEHIQEDVENLEEIQPHFMTPPKKKRKKKTPLPHSMSLQEVEELLDTLKGSRTLFYYFANRYAIILLSYFIQQGLPIKDIKKSPFQPLLGKEPIKKFIAQSGKKDLSALDLETLWPLNPLKYILTLDYWGENEKYWDDYYQTSRPGTNIVLQLNFTNEHRQQFNKLLSPNTNTFQRTWHPIAKAYHTLAWSRIDFPQNMEYALIEEIQNDWLREALECKQELDGASDKKEVLLDYGIDSTPEKFYQYYNNILAPHRALWDQAMLTATILFLRQELGIKKIYYHTFESGNFLKQLQFQYPPKSLYTTLPKKFCFQKTAIVPEFLSDSIHFLEEKNKKKTKLQFYLLDL